MNIVQLNDTFLFTCYIYVTVFGGNHSLLTCPVECREY